MIHITPNEKSVMDAFMGDPCCPCSVVAARTGKSEKTVEAHLRHIRDKLGCYSKRRAIEMYFQRIGEMECSDRRGQYVYVSSKVA